MTDFSRPDRIDAHAAPEGVVNADYLNALAVYAESKLDLIGGMVVQTTAPTGGQGVVGEYCYNTTTQLLHLKTGSTTWNAGVAFAIDGVDGVDGVDGASFNMAVATIEPADIDKIPNTAYFIRGTPVPVSYATAGGRTITAADILAQIMVRNCAGAARIDTLPTAALLVAAMTGTTRVVGEVVPCLIVNGSATTGESLTIAAGTGGTFDPNQLTASRIVDQGTSKTMRIRLTNVTGGSEAYRVYL